MKSKICSRCHLEKPLSQFNKDSSLKSGFASYCKACSRIKWLEYKERHNITKIGGFSNEDARPVRVSPEEKFQDIFASVEYYIFGGKYVMKEGKILDQKWYQKKLAHIKKGFRLTYIPSPL